MKRLDNLKKNGYKVVVLMNGNGCMAIKGNQTYKANSISALHKLILGY